jgi:hypothetical protein
MQNYELLIERIAKAAGLEKEEVETRVEAKKAKLSGLISKEGAAQIIAAELSVNFEDQELKISELMAGMRKVNVVGKIVNVFPVREFNKNGREGKVLNFILADDTGSTRAVLWDVNHISLFENGELKEGDVVEIKNGSTRDSEVHLSSFSELKKSEKVMDNIKTAAAVSEGTLVEAMQGQNIKVRGIVVQVFQPRFYNVCPECNKKVLPVPAGAPSEDGKDEGFKCAEHGIVEAKKRAILNFVLDDGTESMRTVMFSDQIKLLVSEEDLADEAKAAAFRDDFIGTEVYLSGNVKRNQLFNNLEIVASDIEKVDVEKLIESLDNSNS